MRRVCVVGCGTTPFTGKSHDRLESILLRSVQNMLKNSRCDAGDVDAVLVANAAGGYSNNNKTSNISNTTTAGSDIAAEVDVNKSDDKSHMMSKATHAAEPAPRSRPGSGYMASVLAELAGMRPKISHSVESLCSSGSNAIVTGYAYIASNLADVVMVSGAEMRDTQGRVLWWDDSRGQFKHPIYWASILTRGYRRAFGASDEDLAMVPARAFANARANPDALKGKRAHTLHDVMQSRRLTDDIRLLDCSRPCTGGATILLASEEAHAKYTDSPVWITGIGQKTLSAGFAKTQSTSRIESTMHACRDALRMAQGCATSHIRNDLGNGSRGTGTSGVRPIRGILDIDVAEIHDAFSVCEPMILEALGMAEFGKGVQASRDLYETQSRSVNPRGGLIGAGHPLGATGVAQVVEVTRQLLSEAHGRQADSPESGLVHNMAAAGTSSTVLIMQR